jgi:hypothetical protein
VPHSTEQRMKKADQQHKKEQFCNKKFIGVKNAR